MCKTHPFLENIAVHVIFLMFVLLSFAAALTFSCSAYALSELSADEQAMIDEASQLKKDISEKKSIYLDNIRKCSEIDAKIKELSKKEKRAKTEYDEASSELNDFLVVQYRGNYKEKILGLMAACDRFSYFMQLFDYIGYINDKKNAVVEKARTRFEKLSQTRQELENARTEYQREAEKADSSRKHMEDSYESIKPKINAISDKYVKSISYKNGGEQLKETMSFLKAFDDITSTQERIIRSAYNVGSLGGGMCEAWAEKVYRLAGLNVAMLPTAYDGWDRYGVSADVDSCPVGAFVYGGGANTYANHVGICVGNDGFGNILIMDEGQAGKGHQAVTYDEWVSWQKNVSQRNGKSGWFGWGVPEKYRSKIG